MAGKDTILINDDLFQQTISCPLKFTHITKSQKARRQSGMLFRQRNKLHIRDAIAHQFENCRYTSSPTQQAHEETANWLKQDSVAICGAVVNKGNLLTRIPILIKEKNHLTIIQVHGKLRKRSEGVEISPTINKRSILRYLLKAAYRMEVLKRVFPESDVKVDFYFPNKHFKSSLDHLHLFLSEEFENDDDIRYEFKELFSKVKATDAVEKINEKIPESIAHQSFADLSVAKAIEQMMNLNQDQSEKTEINRHTGCKYCEFRLPEMEKKDGCWNKFFFTKKLHHPEKHVFELIGHGNSSETDHGTFYQEEAELSRGFRSFEDTQKYGGSNITILQRRNLQILQARDESVPSLWMKPGVKSLEKLEYPLHFLDFEAATYAIPLRGENRPYTPIFFQFSCHTLKENGTLVHTEWLDQQEEETYPHVEFVNQLRKIPDIFEGTIMQYSPFEKQGVNRLIGDLKREPNQFQTQIEILEKIRKSEFPGYENRFFDISRIISDFYFNKFFNDGLGLKQVLSSILLWEKTFGNMDLPQIRIDDSVIDMKASFSNGGIPDPYKQIQNSDFLIADGAAAMNAWLSFKNGLLSGEEELQIPKMLRKYCSLDSFALYVIYRHIRKFTDSIENEDLILF